MRLTNAGSPSQSRRTSRAPRGFDARSCLELEPVNLLAQAGEVVRLALRNVKLAPQRTRLQPQHAQVLETLTVRKFPLRRRALGLGRAVPETGRARWPSKRQTPSRWCAAAFSSSRTGARARHCGG